MNNNLLKKLRSYGVKMYIEPDPIWYNVLYVRFIKEPPNGNIYGVCYTVEVEESFYTDKLTDIEKLLDKFYNSYLEAIGEVR